MIKYLYGLYCSQTNDLYNLDEEIILKKSSVCKQDTVFTRFGLKV